MNSIRSSNRSLSSRNERKNNYRLMRQKMGKAVTTFCHLSSGETIEEPVTRFELLDNYSDYLNNTVIEFYLPKPATVKLILMDSDRNDAIYLIDKELSSGRHIYKSQISSEEIKTYRYYFKLDAYGYSEIKRMR